MARPGVLGVVVIGLGLFLPLRFDSSGALSLNEACADTLCCFEVGSICGTIEHYTPHHYTSGNGSCPE